MGERLSRAVTRVVLATALLSGGVRTHVARAEIVSATVAVRGMTCTICSSSVERRLKKLHFVESAMVDWKKGLADLLPRPGQTFDGRRLLREIHAAGFTPGMIHVVADGTLGYKNGAAYLTIAPNQVAVLRDGRGGDFAARLPAGGAVRVSGRFADPSGDTRASVAIDVDDARLMRTP